jgi:hypothetical protein
MVKFRDPAGPASRFCEFLAEVVSSATAGHMGGWKHSAVRCRKRPGRRPCTGRILVLQRDTGEINWQCPVCRIQGTIRGWQEGWSDLSEFAPERKLPGFEIRLAERQYDDLKKRLTDEPGCDNIIYGATWSKEGIILRVTFEELQEFAETIAAVASQEAHSGNERILDTLFNCIRSVSGKWSSS